jgi:transcriptional regulator GlxA family with amidase domain
MGPKTTWMPRARWVEDNSGPVPIWSSSGVTAGMYLMYHFIEHAYGAGNATEVERNLEYVRNKDPNNDPFYRNETTTVGAGEVCEEE